MNNDGEPDGTQIKRLFDFGRVVAFLGAISVVYLTLAAAFSWAFARGFIGFWGFPAQIITLHTSFDHFSSVAFEYVGAFLALLVVGFLIKGNSSTKTLRRLYLSMILRSFGLIIAVLVDFVGQIWEINSHFYTEALFIAFCLVTFLAGSAFRDFGVAPRTCDSVADHQPQSEIPNPLPRATSELRRPLASITGALDRFRFWSIGLAGLVAIYTCMTFMYQFGREFGSDISTNAVPRTKAVQHGLATIKAIDFPLISVVTKQKLTMHFEAVKDGESFEYNPPPRDGFIRLITQDDDYYFVIENFHGAVRPMAIRKELVSQLIFLNE